MPEGEVQDVLSLAAHPGALSAVALVAGEQGHRLKEVGRLNGLQYLLLVQALFAVLPVLSQVELVRREGGGHQLEDGQRHAAGVHLLEDLADGLLARVPRQLDRGHSVLVEALEDIGLELVEGVELPLIVAKEPLVASAPR